MAHNRYIQDCEVVPFHDEQLNLKGVFVYGKLKFDPNAMIEPHCISPMHMGKPHQMVLHIAGATYYPTKTGYVRVDNI